MRALLWAALLLPLHVAAQAPMARLFFAPEERAALEAARARASRPAERPVPHVTGYVKRSDGHNMVWLDDVPFPADDNQYGRALQLGPAVPVNVRSTLQARPAVKQSAESARPARPPPTSGKKPGP